MADPAKSRKSALFSDAPPRAPRADPPGSRIGAVVSNLSRCLNWLDEASAALQSPNLDPEMRAFYLRELPLVTQDTRELVASLLRNTAAAVTSNDNH